MKRVLCFLILAVLCTAASPSLVRADNEELFDVFDISCGEILQMEEPDRQTLIYWLHGYLSHKDGTSLVSIKVLEDFSQSLGEACHANPQASLGDFIEK